MKINPLSILFAFIGLVLIIYAGFFNITDYETIKVLWGALIFTNLSILFKNKS